MDIYSLLRETCVEQDAKPCFSRAVSANEDNATSGIYLQ